MSKRYVKPAERPFYPDHPVLKMRGLCTDVKEDNIFDHFHQDYYLVSVLLCRTKVGRYVEGHGYIIFRNPAESSRAYMKPTKKKELHYMPYNLEVVQPETRIEAGTDYVYCEYSSLNRDETLNGNSGRSFIAFRPSLQVFNDVILPTFKQFVSLSPRTPSQQNIASSPSYGLLDSLLTSSFAISKRRFPPSFRQSRPSSLPYGPLPVSVIDIENAAEKDRKAMLCNNFFPRVKELYPELACKIIYILLSMHIDEVLDILEDPDLFRVRTEQAKSLCEELMKTGH